MSQALSLLHLEQKKQWTLNKSPLSLGGPECEIQLSDLKGTHFQIIKRSEKWQIMALGNSVLKINGQVVDLGTLEGGTQLELNGAMLQIQSPSKAKELSTSLKMAHFIREFKKVVLSENPEESLAYLVQISCMVMDADHAELELYKPTPQKIRYPLNAEFPLSQTLLDRAKKSQEIVVWDQNANSEDFTKSIVRNNLSSIIVLPFVIDGENQGYLYVQRQDRSQAFAPDDLELFKATTELLQAMVFNVKRKVELLEQVEDLISLTQKGNLLYADESMAKLVQQIERSAKIPVPVFIYGETGTGKEVMAKHLHDHSDRKDKSFVAINCGAIPENLIESELFGHLKGSFTGAISDKKGLFEEAHGGTVFLDEIGELPLAVQVKLLRVLQEKKISPIGSPKEIPVDFRLVSATHVNLEKAIAAGKFREDLFFRINLMTVEIPPLRERGQDVILLAQHFLDRFAAEFNIKGIHFSKAAEKALLRHAWSGNVRELQNRVQKALIQCNGESILPEDLGLSEDKIKPRRTLREAREEAEKEVVQAALQESQGNLTLAGSILGIDRKVLRELLDRLGLSKDDFK